MMLTNLRLTNINDKKYFTMIAIRLKINLVIILEDPF